MQSSPAYADLLLELPVVTVAERLAAVVVALATGFAAWVLARDGRAGLATAAACGGTLAFVLVVRVWTRSRRRAPLALWRRADGTLWLQAGNGAPIPVVLAAGTRMLGRSVYLDLRFAAGRGLRHQRRWLTPLDVPAATLRRWCVVLPRTGRETAS